LHRTLELIRLMDPRRTRFLGITGGEPTLNVPELLQVIRACREKLPKTQLVLLTNGKKLGDLELAKQIVTAGRLWLSLSATSPPTGRGVPLVRRSYI
jgi:MoaA/NifB/PqqE/SkfB family radical SAM enzyme